MLTVYITRDISCVQYIYLISVSNFKHKDLYQVRYLYLTPGQGREDLAVHRVKSPSLKGPGTLVKLFLVIYIVVLYTHSDIGA